MKCNICKTESKVLFKGLLLNKYKVDYFKCPNCDFIQTEKPYWLDEAYSSAIADLDIGLVSRNITLSEKIEKIIKNNFNFKGTFLDYAGGYGLFVRLMRDKGFDFYRDDEYCENLFAKYHDLSDLGDNSKFELVTAFEVFEHFNDPMKEIEKIFKYSDSVIFSTELQIGEDMKSIEDWWYFVPETGQHVSFYSYKTFEYIAKKFNLGFYSKENLHLLSKRKFNKNPLSLSQYNMDDEIRMKSFVQADFDLAKSIILKDSSNKKNNNNNKDRIDGREDLKHRLMVAFAQLDSTNVELDSVNYELNLTEKELGLFKDRLNRIYDSREWRAALMMRKIVKIIIPNGSFRREKAVIIWRFIKTCFHSFRGIINYTKGVFSLCRRCLIGAHSSGKRKINKNSKKIAYIGHSYHNKTKSTGFLLDYLNQFCDVEIILDESWRGQGYEYPDLSFIDRSYLGVIFFQNLPNPDVLKKINNDNIIFFPMYDGVRHDYAFWNEYYDLKIVNFSSTLHKKLAKWGFDSIGVQFFPKPQDFFPGEKNSVFFWQRLTSININIISKLFGDVKLKIHMHKAIDPNQQLVEPSKEQENKYNITYSEWFDTREEMQELIKENGLYIAPREFEGIGMSFLEAMSMGKAVVAVDNPTMNEYIEHGKTGYLFDLKNPKKIDFSDIEQVQKNTYDYMKAGYEKWEREKHGIIDFIEKA